MTVGQVSTRLTRYASRLPCLVALSLLSGAFANLASGEDIGTNVGNCQDSLHAVHEHGSTWKDSSSGCRQCQCSLGTVSCVDLDRNCSVDLSGCADGEHVVPAVDACSCPTCEADIGSCKDASNATWTHGASWNYPTHDGCQSCWCNTGQIRCGELAIDCIFNAPCTAGQRRIPAKDTCHCYTCEREAGPLAGCVDPFGQFHRSGENWDETVQGCFSCRCHNGTRMCVDRISSCPSLDNCNTAFHIHIPLNLCECPYCSEDNPSDLKSCRSLSGVTYNHTETYSEQRHDQCVLCQCRNGQALCTDLPPDCAEVCEPGYRSVIDSENPCQCRTCKLIQGPEPNCTDHMGVLHAPGSTYMQASHTALKCERCQCVNGVEECRDHTPTCAAQCADGEHNDLDALDPCGCQACYPTAPSTKIRCIDSDLQPRSIGEWYRDTRSGQCMICHCQATSAVCRLMQPSCTGGCEEGFEPALDENNPCECVCRPISGCDFRGQQYANGDTWTVSAYHNCSCLNGTAMCELRAVKTCSPGALPCPTEAFIRSKNAYECDRCPADGETCPRQRVSFWFIRSVTCEFCFCISGRARCIPNPFGCSPCGPDHLEYPRVDSCSCPFCVPISNGA